MANPRPNPFGNHCGTKHKVDKRTGGANRGQGNISNEERARRAEAQKQLQIRQDEARKKQIEREKQKAREAEAKRKREYEANCKLAAQIYSMAVEEDDNDNDDEEQEELDNNGNNDEGEYELSSPKRALYMPKKDSTIYNLMKAHENKMKSALSRQTSSLWMQRNRIDPVAANVTSPEEYYKSRFEVFNWLVCDSFNIDIKQIKCVHCKEVGVKQHSYCWAPMICLDKKVWVYHQRLVCKCCKKYFRTIEQQFLAQLPTRIVERFEFYARKRGPGLHQSLVHQFISLIGTGVMFGSYVKSINEMMSIKYSMDQVSYYDSIGDLEESQITFAPKPFSRFDDPGKYSGIKLTKRLLKEAVFSYMITREPYMQAAFQLVYDEGTQADHSHKFADIIHLGGWLGKTFTASYTIMSQKGLVTSNRLTYTKGTEELKQLLQEIKECRERNNAGPLKKFSSDCLNIDGKLWRDAFPELRDNVIPYKQQDDKLPMLGLTPDSFVYLTTISQMNNTANAIMNEYDTESRIVYGLDTECCWGDNDVKLMQVSFPPVNGNEQKTYLFDFNAAEVDKSNFPTSVRRMLLRENFIPTGRAIGTDVTRIRNSMGITIKCWIELRSLALTVMPTITATGLEDLVRVFLKANLDKEGQHGDYSKNPLPMELQTYAALDAYVSRLLYEVLSSRLPLPHGDVIYKGPGVCDVNDLTEAELFLGGKTVAKCTIVYVGKKESIETRKWGKTTIKHGKVLVKLDEVWQRNVHPPLSFASADESLEPSWKKSDVVIGDLEDKEILVNIASIIVKVKGFEGTISGKYLQRNPIPTRNDENASDAATTNNENTSISVEEEQPDPFLVFQDDINDSFDDNEHYRSRQKEDIFHQFKILLDLIPKTEVLRNFLLRLVVHASFIFHEEDFERVENHLKATKFDSNDPRYLQKLMDDFYFRREWWRERCRTYITKSADHAARLKRVVEAIHADDELSKLYTPKVQEYFDNFILKAMRGEFEEQDDVVLFIQRGKDTNGLPLYYRLRGTVRTENLHQKMKMAIGPWNVGPKSAHVLLVLICYRYNVMTKIRRCGQPDFGHFELHYIDRIQNRVREIFNILVWPRYDNQSVFRGKEDMVSVGIGPLTYNPKYVEHTSEPDATLSGDRLFMAKQMQLRYPILHIGSRHEIRIFNDFMKENNATEANFKKLAEIYKNAANGKDVFYKLPNMLKSYSKTWGKNSELKSKEKGLNHDVNILLEELFCTRISGDISKVPPTVKATAAQVEETMNAERNDNEEAATAAMFVGAVEGQGKYVHSTINIAPISLNDRRCAWFPACGKLQRECGGNRKDLCQDFKNRINDDRFIAENEANKKAYNLKRKRLLMKEKRKRKKKNDMDTIRL